jgi:ParB/RepB/Spo0J family partition protein
MSTATQKTATPTLSETEAQYLAEVVNLAAEYAAKPEGLSPPQARMLAAKLTPGNFLPDREDSAEAFDQLVADIQANDIHTPILVQIPDTNRKPDKYPIIAGERRWRAACKLKLPWMPCVFFAVDDQAAAALALSENMNRKNMTRMEEAAAIAELRKVGLSWEIIADRLGMSAKGAARKAQLAHLVPEIRTRLDDPSEAEDWGSISLRVLEYIASLPEQTQRELETHQSVYRLSNGPSERVIAWIEEEHLSVLQAARWDLDDAELDPAAGPCTECTERTDRQAFLFDDKDQKAKCLRPDCYGRKQRAYVVEIIRQCVAKGQKPALVNKSYPVQEPWTVDETTYRIVSEYEGKRVASGKVPGAQRAIYLDRGGTLGWFVPGHTATRGVKAQRATAKLSAPELRARKRTQWVLSAVRDELAEAKTFGRLEGDHLVQFAVLANDVELINDEGFAAKAYDLFMDDCACRLATQFRVSGVSDPSLGDKCGRAKRLLETFCSDTGVFHRLVQGAEEAIPEPSGRHARLTRKQGKKGPAKKRSSKGKAKKAKATKRTKQ